MWRALFPAPAPYKLTRTLPRLLKKHKTAVYNLHFGSEPSTVFLSINLLSRKVACQRKHYRALSTVKVLSPPEFIVSTHVANLLGMSVLISDLLRHRNKLGNLTRLLNKRRRFNSDKNRQKPKCGSTWRFFSEAFRCGHFVYLFLQTLGAPPAH